jgi:hypothetical protein
MRRERRRQYDGELGKSPHGGDGQQRKEGTRKEKSPVWSLSGVVDQKKTDDRRGHHTLQEEGASVGGMQKAAEFDDPAANFFA